MRKQCGKMVPTISGVDTRCRIGVAHNFEGTPYCRYHYPPTVEQKKKDETARAIKDWALQLLQEKQEAQAVAAMRHVRIADGHEAEGAVLALVQAAFFVHEAGIYSNWQKTELGKDLRAALRRFEVEADAEGEGR